MLQAKCQKACSGFEKKGFVAIRQSSADVRAFTIEPTDKMKDYFDNIFASYQTQLKYLFEDYSEEEIKQLFQLLMRLYGGIDHLEKKLELAEKGSL